jgi:3-hydroxyisobutyrate dehydrogenase-like beta-hydroxyacid dehydrogenase
MRVGFIGLGNQGGPMARAIVDSGFETTLWARRPATLEPYVDTEAKVAGTPAELGANSDLACVCVVGDSDVEEVLCGETGVLAGMAADGIVAVHSTVHPETCRRLAETAADNRISLIDAPVSGGAPAVAERRLLVMVGGNAEVVERCRPVFETYGSHVHLGDVGSGQLAKLLNNLVFTANLANAKTALDFGAALGVDPASLGEVLTRGSANSSALGSIAPLGGSLDVIRDVAGPLLQKDVRLIADIAEKSGQSPGAALDAADAALLMLGHPR